MPSLSAAPATFTSVRHYCLYHRKLMIEHTVGMWLDDEKVALKRHRAFNSSRVAKKVS